MPRKNLKRWQREEQLKDLFRVMGEGEATVNDIARILDVTPSPHLRGILFDLVKAGVLECREVPHRRNVMKVLFRKKGGGS